MYSVLGIVLGSLYTLPLRFETNQKIGIIDFILQMRKEMRLREVK